MSLIPRDVLARILRLLEVRTILEDTIANSLMFARMPFSPTDDAWQVPLYRDSNLAMPASNDNAVYSTSDFSKTTRYLVYTRCVILTPIDPNTPHNRWLTISWQFSVLLMYELLRFLLAAFWVVINSEWSWAQSCINTVEVSWLGVGAWLSDTLQ